MVSADDIIKEVRLSVYQISLQPYFFQQTSSSKEGSGRITGAKLTELLTRKTSSKKEAVEEIVCYLLLQSYLSEDFHFTPYSIIRFSESLSQTRSLSVTCRLAPNGEWTLRRRSTCRLLQKKIRHRRRKKQGGWLKKTMTTVSSFTSLRVFIQKWNVLDCLTVENPSFIEWLSRSEVLAKRLEIFCRKTA